jgi:hypothetical protein
MTTMHFSPYWRRLIAIVLIPSLVSDPCLAQIIQFSTRESFIAPPQAAFREQAIPAPDVGALFRRTFSQAGTVALIVLLAGGMFDADQTNAQSTKQPPLTKVVTRQPIGPVLSTPNQDDERVRQDILEIFRNHQNFRTEINQMFNQGLIDPASGLQREQIHEAMTAFVRFIQRARIERLNDETKDFAVSVTENRFYYSASSWETLKTLGLGHLFHEALHFAANQQRLASDLALAMNWIEQNYPGIRPQDKPRVLQNREFRNAAWIAISARWKSELQASFADMAFQIVEAKAQGFATVQEYLLAKAAPLAQSSGLAPQAFLESVLAQGKQPTDPTLTFLSQTWQQFRYYDPGILSLRYEYYIFTANILALPKPSLLLWLMIDDPKIAAKVVQEVRVHTADARSPLAQWAHDTFLRVQPPWEEQNYLRRYGPVVLLLGAGGLGLIWLLWRNRHSNKDRPGGSSSGHLKGQPANKATKSARHADQKKGGKKIIRRENVPVLHHILSAA